MQEKEGIKYWSETPEEVLEAVHSNANGLSAEEAAVRLKQHGQNTLKEQKKNTQLKAFLSQFKNPIILILLVATGISAATGEWIDAMIILAIILASATTQLLSGIYRGKCHSGTSGESSGQIPRPSRWQANRDCIKRGSTGRYHQTFNRQPYCCGRVDSGKLEFIR